MSSSVLTLGLHSYSILGLREFLLLDRILKEYGVLLGYEAIVNVVTVWLELDGSWVAKMIKLGGTRAQFIATSLMTRVPVLCSGGCLRELFLLDVFYSLDEQLYCSYTGATVP
jgi:hypothetical protein